MGGIRRFKAIFLVEQHNSEAWRCIQLLPAARGMGAEETTLIRLATNTKEWQVALIDWRREVAMKRELSSAPRGK